MPAGRMVLGEPAHPQGLSYCICKVERRQGTGALGLCCFQELASSQPLQGVSGRQEREGRGARCPPAGSSGMGQGVMQGCMRPGGLPLWGY